MFSPESFLGRKTAEMANHLVENYVGKLFQIETGESEINIPPDGRLICLFAPHSGWIEPFIIDACFQKVGRSYPFWLTKIENQSLPKILLGNRMVFINREQPGLNSVKAMYEVIQKPRATLATAFEGTRFGNPDNREDVRTLGIMKSGLVHVAINENLPILLVVILGSDRILPTLDQTFKDRRIINVLGKLQEARGNPQIVQVRFLPPYVDHLQEPGQTMRGKVKFHTKTLTELLVNQILALDSNYPLGSYESLRVKL